MFSPNDKQVKAQNTDNNFDQEQKQKGKSIQQQPQVQQQFQVSDEPENIIKLSQLPPGVTEEQVRKSLAGISLLPIKGKIRSEYIPITRMETEYKEEVQYQQVPRQTKVQGYQQKSKDNTPHSENSPQIKQEKNENKQFVQNETKTQTVNYQQIPISGTGAYKQSTQTTFKYTTNQGTNSPVTVISPVQINGQGQSQQSAFSNAIQYAGQPIQRMQGTSPVSYTSPIAYNSPVYSQVAYQSSPTYQPVTYIPQQQMMGSPHRGIINQQTVLPPNYCIRGADLRFLAK